jgi:hypothetical protein
MLPRRPARRLFRGRLLRVGIPTVYDDGAASRADATLTPYYSRDIRLMRSADAEPQVDRAERNVSIDNICRLAAAVGVDPRELLALT